MTVCEASAIEQPVAVPELDKSLDVNSVTASEKLISKLGLTKLVLAVVDQTGFAALLSTRTVVLVKLLTGPKFCAASATEFAARVRLTSDPSAQAEIGTT